jgi:hypothetical protein
VGETPISVAIFLTVRPRALSLRNVFIFAVSTNDSADRYHQRRRYQQSRPQFGPVRVFVVSDHFHRCLIGEERAKRTRYVVDSPVKVFIDDSGSFNWHSQGRSLFCGVTIPDRAIASVFDWFARWRRTARWAATTPGAGMSDVDLTLDKEVDFGVRIADRVLHALLKKHPGLFPQRREPIYAPDEDSPA